MLREDGTAEFYVIEKLRTLKDASAEWSRISPYVLELGLAARHEASRGTILRMLQDYERGDVWKETACLGLYSRSDTFRLRELLALPYPNCKFRVVEVRIIQDTRVVVEPAPITKFPPVEINMGTGGTTIPIPAYAVATGPMLHTMLRFIEAWTGKHVPLRALEDALNAALKELPAPKAS
jgi:hypothetical protein